jgi:hypothetical protein
MRRPVVRLDAAHWRKRAWEARAIADEMRDELSRMLRISEGYERLAVQAQGVRAAIRALKAEGRDRRETTEDC